MQVEHSYKYNTFRTIYVSYQRKIFEISWTNSKNVAIIKYLDFGVCTIKLKKLES